MMTVFGEESEEDVIYCDCDYCLFGEEVEDWNVDWESDEPIEE